MGRQVEVVGDTGILNSDPLTIVNKKTPPPPTQTTRVIAHKTWVGVERPEDYTAKLFTTR